MIFKDKQTNVVLYLVHINTEPKDLHDHKHKTMFTKEEKGFVLNLDDELCKGNNSLKWTRLSLHMER